MNEKLKSLLKQLLGPLRTINRDASDFLISALPGHYGFYEAIKRRILLMSGARVGSNIYIASGVHILNPKNLVLGDNTVISENVVITASGGVMINSYSLIGYGSKILSANHKIPENKGIIWGAGHDYAPVNIETGVWIGANVVILPGIKVGQGSVIAAGAVVTKNVPEFSIVGGNPAKLIRERK